MYKQLKLFAVICTFALISNLIFVFVLQIMEYKVKTTLTINEENENHQNSGKRVINLLEEEMHLHESFIHFVEIKSQDEETKTNFKYINNLIKEIYKIPLENPPEYQS